MKVNEKMFNVSMVIAFLCFSFSMVYSAITMPRELKGGVFLRLDQIRTEQRKNSEDLQLLINNVIKHDVTLRHRVERVTFNNL